MNKNNDKDIILDVRHLTVRFKDRHKEGTAVDDVSFQVRRGKVLGIVGESGSGKSVTSLAIMQLLGQTNAVVEATDIDFLGENLLNKKKKEMQNIRGKHIAMIFQEPMTSLNPALTVGTQITETIIKHEKVSKTEAWKRAKNLLDTVQIPLSEERLREYPHQLSGGMRQRVMIAMALSCNPELIIADEPTTALDVTIQSQILELFKKLQAEYKQTMILITHDMGVIAETADDVMVMYAGRVVEYGDTESVLVNPKHPYTKALIRAIPNMSEGQELETIPGNIPSIYNMPNGCNFNSRCASCQDRCKEKKPHLVEVEGRLINCLLYE